MSVSPPKTMEEMLLLSSFGAHLEMSTFMAGKVRPPPRPSRTRIKIRYCSRRGEGNKKKIQKWK